MHVAEGCCPCKEAGLAEFKEIIVGKVPVNKAHCFHSFLSPCPLLLKVLGTYVVPQAKKD